MRLLALLLYRLVWFVPTLLGLLVVTFVISRVIPADPVALVAGETATPAQVEALRRELGYDRPLPVQFVDYVARLVRGDMGTSIFTRRPIAEDLAHRLPATIELTVVAMVVSVLVGIPLGVLSALWRNSLLDHALRVVTVSGPPSRASGSASCCSSSSRCGSAGRRSTAACKGSRPARSRASTSWTLPSRSIGRRSAWRCCTWRCPRRPSPSRRWPRSCASRGPACWT